MKLFPENTALFCLESGKILKVQVQKLIASFIRILKLKISFFFLCKIIS